MYNIKKFIKKNYIWIILIILFLIFVGSITELYFTDIIKYDDVVKTLFVNNLRSDIITFVARFFTFFGSALMLIILSITSMFVLKNKRESICICSNLLLATLLNQLFKFIIKRPRPVGYNLITENGFSFPSGHSMVSMAFYGYIIYLINIKIKNKNIKILLSIIISLFILLIGCSRIYLGVHFASDVVSGFILAIIYLVLFIKFTDKYVLKGNKHENNK